MMSIYRNLDALLRSDKSAQNYYADLPDYAKESLKERARDIRSLAEMRQFVDSYLAGDR
ncbi:MAG: hypothetical protein LBD16_05355 [Oscillospiraceae bacterium]|jgi:hypothetical protein|nr:hypothetical protein [Oscillospiraceae bacterium]